MAIIINSDGTLSQSFQLGDTAKLNYDGVDGLQITDGGATLATLQVATPTSADDAATKDYVDTIAGTDATAQVLKLDLAFNSGAVVDSTTDYAVGTYALRIIVKVSTVFDGGNADATMSVGWADGTGTGAEFLSTTVVDLYSADTYILDIIETNATGGVSSIEINYSVDSGAAATQGAAEVYVYTTVAPQS